MQYSLARHVSYRMCKPFQRCTIRIYKNFFMFRSSFRTLVPYYFLHSQYFVMCMRRYLKDTIENTVVGIFYSQLD